MANAAKKGGVKAPPPAVDSTETIHIDLQKDGTWIAGVIDGPWVREDTRENALYALLTSHQKFFNVHIYIAHKKA
jgi:hypothetical protein